MLCADRSCLSAAALNQSILQLPPVVMRRNFDWKNVDSLLVIAGQLVQPQTALHQLTNARVLRRTRVRITLIAALYCSFSAHSRHKLTVPGNELEEVK
ncbi:unnamed protein product [Pleuronectes platessa]|uniref:Uncharacterized protein n=1 Tax=Pleuronectes platessa TaxID=8262 RepID=A0A9N7VJI9_PLEPL|nr:unnamed protein product [Pleuronectes platessa]